jgi:NAD(P)-dependent dehydrogenase (short-subunit alcohol dehydrogenase family)
VRDSMRMDGSGIVGGVFGIRGHDNPQHCDTVAHLLADAGQALNSLAQLGRNRAYCHCMVLSMSITQRPCQELLLNQTSACTAPTGIFPVHVAPYYAAAKGGLVHFTRSLAPRLAPFGIQLATVCPQ